MPAFRFNGGVVTSRDRSALEEDELQQATGIMLKPGDTSRVHKIGGRTVFADSGVGLPVKGMALCQFDPGGTDKLLAYAANTVFGATPGLSGSFSPIAGLISLDASATRLATAHAYNKWFVGNGYDRQKVLKSDGTTRRHGMAPPAEAPTCVAGLTTSTTQRPSATSGASGLNMTSPAKCYDTPGAGQKITSTFGYWQQSVIVGSPNVLAFTTFGASTAASRKLTVAWSLDASVLVVPPIGIGGHASFGGSCTMLLEYSTNSGSSWATLDTVTTDEPTGIRLSSIPISVNSNLVQVRVTYTYAAILQVTAKIYDIRISNGATTSISTTTGLFYAVSEVDANNAIESVAGPASDLVTLSVQNIVTITLPAAAINANATHWRVYRTFDGGSTPQTLGRLHDVPIAQTTTYDDFTEFDKDTGPTPLYALLAVTLDGGTVYVPRDGEPPIFQQVTFWKGSLIGVSRVAPRTLAYSFAGRPESFPLLYVIETWPMPEHDTLVAAVGCGDTLIVAGADTMMALDDLPRVTQGIFSNVDIRPLRSQPGCVNQDAIVAFSVAGEPRVAWISHYGLHQTNGTTSSRISLDIDWTGSSGLGDQYAATAILKWDPQLQALIVCYDSNADGVNNFFYYIFMAPEHQKPNGQPKWTGPHYGKIRSMASGIVSGSYIRWSGHASDGAVYVENTGGTDASQSYSGTIVPILLTSARRYGPEREMAVYKASLRHTAFGGGRTLSAAWTSGRDASGQTQTKSSTVSVATQGSTQFLVARQGEWHELSVTDSGATQGGIQDCIYDAMPGARPGRVA